MTTARGTGQIVDITSARYPELEFMVASQAEARKNVDLVFALVRTQNSTGMTDNLVLMLDVSDYSNPAVTGSFAISGYSVSHHPLDDYPVKTEVRYKKYGDAYKMFFVSSYRHPVFGPQQPWATVRSKAVTRAIAGHHWRFSLQGFFPGLGSLHLGPDVLLIPLISGVKTVRRS